MDNSESMETPSVKLKDCILHLDNGKSDNLEEVVKLQLHHWEVIQKSAKSRSSKINFKQSKYFDVIASLPVEYNSQYGYHKNCYKNFTAISHKSVDSGVSTQTLLRSTTDRAESSRSTGIFEKNCIFCNSKRKKKGDKFEYVGACQTKDAEILIKRSANILKDNKLLTKISSIDFVAKEVHYHHSCRTNYLKAARRIEDRDNRPNTDEKKCESESLIAICKYVNDYIIKKKRSELLTSVYSQYLTFCEECGEVPVSSAQYLMKILLKKFDKQLKSHSDAGKKQGVILYNVEISPEAVRKAYDFCATSENIIVKAALVLRKLLKSIAKSELPNDSTIETLQKGEANPPELVNIFFRTLFGGPIYDNHSTKTIRRAASSSQDALFIVSNGTINPAKHISLGGAIKSLTGSKKLLTILNRFGHCSNYNFIEELETMVGENIQNQNTCLPADCKTNVPFGVAFDNFDELCETLSGSNTLHDTMGIMYQAESISSECMNIPTSTIGKGSNSRKRKLDVTEFNLQPYRKKPRMSIFEYQCRDVWKFMDTKRRKEHLDFTWMVCYGLMTTNIPMWVGFNSQFYVDELQKQRVMYMKNLQQPITQLDVIQHTLQITQQCAEEIGQKYGVVSYDLNAAKPAMQIQATEKPLYDNIFIMPGVFHIEMAMFKAIGKVIDGSGGPAMLTESLVLSSGSLNGFLSGTHFNRCKRLHPLLAISLETLFFQKCLDQFPLADDFRDFISSIDGMSGSDIVAKCEGSTVFNSAMVFYNQFKTDTLAGKHGATSQFWIMYVTFIQNFHLMERAIRTNDVELYSFALTPIIDLFFATNHVNYARWLTKFQLDLINIDNTHPGLSDLLNSGVFTVRRTDHSFSRIPVDLTLEQSINANAASRQTGLSHMTNNFGARQRWMVTRPFRALMVSSILQMAGMSNPENASNELKPTRIMRDHEDYSKIVKQIKNSCDPFILPEDTDDSLINISTGKSVTSEIKNNLLTITERGAELHKQFIEDCIADPNRFEKPIKRQKLLTFSDGSIRNTKSTSNKVASLKCTRDLMGRLLLIAVNRKLDLEYVLTYPLTPVPLSMCNYDGTLAKTDKSTLFRELEKMVNGDTLINPSLDAYVIDGNFLLHLLPNKISPTYGGLASTILIMATSTTSKRVDLLFDTYKEPSIKDCERQRRGAEEQEFIITGPDQLRPRNLSDALKSTSFKKNLPSFLIEEWKKLNYSTIIKDCHLYVAHLNQCHHFFVENNEVRHECIATMESNHEEADTMICFHAKVIDETEHPGNIVVRASDTDIAVILIHHSHKFAATVWMDVGTCSRNSRRYINISQIATTLGTSMCAALPAFHVFTGSDFTSAFVRKGKVRPLTLLKNDKKAQHSFSLLTKECPISESVISELGMFLSKIYGANKSETSLNSYRYKMLQRGFSPKREDNPFAKIKGINASDIPPCQFELSPHIRRVGFVTRMWSMADTAFITCEPSAADGWYLKDSHYHINWFDGCQMPERLIPDNTDETGESDDELILAVGSSDESDADE